MKKVQLSPEMRNLANDIQLQLNKTKPIAEILAAKNCFRTVEDVMSYLDFNESNIPLFNLINDSRLAIERVVRALMVNEHVGIHTDYDDDGVMGGSIMTIGLRKLGMKVSYFTNDRFKDGFGMKIEGAKRFLAQHPDITLIITVDNGIVANDAVDYLNSRGIDVIITDHHEPNEELPKAYAVLDCKRKDNTYPFTDLCGAGLAYKFIKAIYEEVNGDKEVLQSLLPLVAMGTVGDCVSLSEENRFYVKEGLKLMGKDRVFNELAYQLKKSKIDEETLGYYFVPTVNAYSRLRGDAILPIDLFTCDRNDSEFISNTVKKLVSINEERKTKTEEETNISQDVIERENLEVKKTLVIKDNSFEEGIVGITAGRLTERYNRPSIVFANIGNGLLKGSARSVEGFNLKESFDKIQDCIFTYGGHAMAAGITIEESKFDEFYSRLEDLAKDLEIKENQDSEIIVDTIIKPDEINMKLIDELDELRPFGEGNPKILFGIEDFKVEAKRLMGENKTHLKLSTLYNFQDEQYKLNALYFNLGDILDKDISINETVDIIGVPSVNVFKGKVSYDIIINNDNYIEKKVSN